jgi:hypothetical protein
MTQPKPASMALRTPLNPLQLELLKLYSTEMTQAELLELKQELARYFAAKAIAVADQVWDERGLSNEDMDVWLNG